MNRWLLLLAVLAGSGGPAGAADLTPSEAAAARKLYTAKCAKCHRFYEPAAYPEAEWRLWMDKMSRKAKLKPEQEKLLNRYLDACRAERKPAPSEKGK